MKMLKQSYRLRAESDWTILKMMPEESKQAVGQCI
jgi:hypothetical protein